MEGKQRKTPANAGVFYAARWSGRRDLNPGPFAPQANALPVCATPRPEICSVVVCITGPAVSSTAVLPDL